MKNKVNKNKPSVLKEIKGNSKLVNNLTMWNNTSGNSNYNSGMFSLPLIHSLLSK